MQVTASSFNSFRFVNETVLWKRVYSCVWRKSTSSDKVNIMFIGEEDKGWQQLLADMEHQLLLKLIHRRTEHSLGVTQKGRARDLTDVRILQWSDFVPKHSMSISVACFTALQFFLNSPSHDRSWRFENLNASS